MADFKCIECGQTFSLPESVLAKYPKWVPRYCKKHSPGNKAKPKAGASASKGGSRADENLTLDEVLDRFHEGPTSGIFTDGSARPNPGPGGWGLVWVKDNEIIQQLKGHEAHTTNNRMELTALIEAYKLLDKNSTESIHTDSELCLNILTKWAKNWKAKGWKKKDGAIKNLELVQELYALYEEHPSVKIIWVKAHNGWRWNEYADSLSAAWARGKL